MAKKRSYAISGFVFCFLSAVASSSAWGNWNDFRVIVSPDSPTDQESFDLTAFRWFGDPGFDELRKSISIAGHQINLDILIQDLHAGPFVFPQVIVEHTTLFTNVGPLQAGEYQVNARMWSTPWPSTTGGTLLDFVTRTFTVTSTIVGLNLVGDYDGNGNVDAGDFTIWRDTQGNSGDGLAADGNGDATVDYLDFLVWKDHFGASGTGGSAGNSSAAPEPNSLLLVTVAAATASIGFFRRY